MSEQKPKRLGGSSVARIAGNILCGVLANPNFGKGSGLTTDQALDRAVDITFALAVQIAAKADAYDAQPMEWAQSNSGPAHLSIPRLGIYCACAECEQERATRAKA